MLLQWIIFGVIALVSWAVSAILKSRFEEYSKIPTNYGLTGRDVAEKMLRDAGIFDVRVVSVPGRLTDHYNPVDRTVNLSQAVYGQASVAAAAVAAHECGHAIQHAGAYAPLRMRTALVPVLTVSSRWLSWILLAGMLLVNQLGTQLLLVGIVLYAVTTLFSFITLPVEIDASRRALSWLNTAGVTGYATYPKAQSALRWAAYTYVVAALGSLATLMYYIMVYLSRRD